MAFPDTPLGVQVEIQAGGVWTDATPDAYTRDPITITRGQPDGAWVADPSRCTVTLNNKDGRYTPRNPLSPYYGKIGRNTPLRVSVPGVESYLSLPGVTFSGAETSDHSSLDITGDLDIRVEAEVDNWQAGSYPLFGKWGVTGQQSYRLQVDQGWLYLLWSADGNTTLFEGLFLPPLPRRTALRATLDVNNGGGAYAVELFTAPSLEGPWTSLGTVIDGTPTSVFNSTTVAKLGGYTTGIMGRAYRGEIRSGINGTIIASPDLRALTPGTTAWTDSAGRPWSIIGSASVSNRTHRFVGEVSSWPPRWAPSGQDVWTPVEAAGIMRRLGQGTKALDSTLRRRLPSRSPLAYWPCEEPQGATQAYSPTPGVGPLTVTRWDFGQDTELGGSAPLPAIEPGGTMRGRVPPSASGVWEICMPYHVDGTAPGAEQEMLSWTSTGTIRRWRITMGTSGTHLLGYDVTGALVLDSAIGAVTGFFDGWWRLEFRAEQSGGNVAYRLGWTKVNGPGTSVTGSFAGTVGAVSQIDTTFGSGLPDIRVGHITVWPAETVTAAYADADRGFITETAADRLRRLATEESGTVRVSFPDGYPSGTTPMGVQRPDTLVSLLRECADSDLGILAEDREASALVYRARSTRYNQAPKMVLDYAAGDVAPPLEPVDDDEATRNDRTVNRVGGSSGRAVLETGPMSIQAPPLGVGLYDDSVDLSLATDTQPQPIAEWLLHLGTWDESRVPTVQLDLHKRPGLIPAFLALELGDRIQIINLPSWLPPGPIDLIVQGITETPGIRTWSATLTCVPAGPWTVGVLDDPILGRLDTDGTTLGAAVDSDDTSLLLVSDPGPTWITTATHPSEFPFDVLVGGERMTVTGITQGAVDAFGRTVASSWGSADTGGAWTSVGGSAADYSVGSGVGSHTLASVNVARQSTLAAPSPDFDLYATVAASAVATGASIFGGLTARGSGATDLYYARVEFTTSGTVILAIRERAAGVETTVVTLTTPYTYTAGQSFRLRFQAKGSALQARVWPLTSGEPTAWQVSGTDTTLTAAGAVGCRSMLATGNTNVSPAVRYDNFLIANPQLATVTRSVNGIAKSHAAGADLRLAEPLILAL
ncbi:hypothetical protein R1T08_17410 [Streptomyces sp. SBC-4]|nr:hypothetical protein [Streptomyces sp. SBC-4]MDV5145940.1 hypothetical protein [Streptomyces sp. SBC-4]